MNHKSCVIVANGEFPSSEKVINRIKEAKYVIACDGAAINLHKHGLKMDAIVGDLDSFPPELKERYRDIIHKVSEQDTNDLSKATRHALSMGIKEILIVGATGKREDHALGNISLLLDYAEKFDHVEMLSDYGSFQPLLKTRTIRCKSYQQISIISLTPEALISTEGLKWELKNRRLTSWWQGTLNEALSDSFTITLSENSKVLIYLAETL